MFFNKKKKRFLKVKRTPPKLTPHIFSKVNKTKNVHRCKYCLELSTFRVFQARGVNRIACVMCLNSVRYNKHKPINKQGITLEGPFTIKHFLKRAFLRTKIFFTGNHIYLPLKIKRKK